MFVYFEGPYTIWSFDYYICERTTLNVFWEQHRVEILNKINKFEIINMNTFHTFVYKFSLCIHE